MIVHEASFLKAVANRVDIPANKHQMCENVKKNLQTTRDSGILYILLCTPVVKQFYTIG